MFENNKDTQLLHGALISAAGTNSGSLLDCRNFEDTLNIVFNSVNKIINHSLKGIKEEKANIKNQLNIHKRLHAAVFFTTLRSHDMTFDTLDTFYDSIADVWPSIDFKFYIELNFRCDWSEFFIRCASQLPSDIFVQVIKTILDLSLSDHLQIYVWHLILQTLTLKLLEVPYEDEIESSFKVHSQEGDSQNENTGIIGEGEDVGNADLFSKNSQEEKAPFKEMYNNLCNLIFEESKKSKNVDVMKILFHEVKTLLKVLLAERERNYKNISSFIDFMNIYNVLNDNLKSDDFQENLKVTLNNPVNTALKCSYVTTSWNISENYLCFLLSYYWNKIYSDFCFKIELSIRNSLVYSEMIMNSFLYETLNTLNPLFVKSSELDHEHKNFLCEVLHLDLEGASYVAEMLLLNPVLIETNNLVQILEENSCSIDFLKQYPRILQCIKAVKSQDFKFRLLKMFYKLLPKDDMKIYNDVIITILTEHGFTDEFQLPDFSEQLKEVFISNLTIKEAEETFPALFIQNPLNLLKRVIEQTLECGSEGKPYIEALKYVQFACTYQENKDDLPALIGILNDYFEREKLKPWELKNMPTLYKYLIKLQSTRTHIMVVDVFLNRCIIPKLQYGMDKIELILECLHQSISILIKSKTFFVAHDTLISLVISLGKLVNDCILAQNGKLKASVLPLIQALDDHQLTSGDIKDGDKVKIYSSFQSFHEGVFVYMKEFIPANIEFCGRPYLWILYCNSKRVSQFEEQFSAEVLPHSMLLQTLVQVLPSLTKEEWLLSVNLIKIYCKKEAVEKDNWQGFDKLFPLSECELDTYAVVSCLINSFHLIVQEKKDDAYLINCFTNTLMNILSQDKGENTFLLMTILLDCCYLAECVSPEVSKLITLMLVDLKKCIIASCSGKTYASDCIKLLSCAFKCLPDSCGNIY